MRLVLEPQLLRGAVLAEQGAFGEAAACLREGLSGRPGAIRLRPYGLARLAEALARQGEHGAALMAVREGLEEQERTGQRRWEPELRRLEGIALFGLNRIEESQAPSKRRCASREGKRQSPMSCAPRASPGCGANRAGGPKLATSAPPSTAGSPRGSIPPI
jgi:hypothetical protein